MAVPLPSRDQKSWLCSRTGYSGYVINSDCHKYVPVCLFNKSPCPPFKGGIYEGLKHYQHTYNRKVQCRSLSVPPF